MSESVQQRADREKWIKGYRVYNWGDGGWYEWIGGAWERSELAHDPVETIQCGGSENGR